LSFPLKKESVKSKLPKKTVYAQQNAFNHFQNSEIEVLNAKILLKANFFVKTWCAEWF